MVSPTPTVAQSSDVTRLRIERLPHLALKMVNGVFAPPRSFLVNHQAPLIVPARANSALHSFADTDVFAIHDPRMVVEHRHLGLAGWIRQGIEIEILQGRVRPVGNHMKDKQVAGSLTRHEDSNRP